jgi:Peptidyl-prolyl cis-trans isomerase (rotamase) - cyclophilin family
MTPNTRRLSAVRRAVPWLLLASMLGLSSPARAQDLPRVIIRTAMGDMEAEIDTIHAPVTSANFLRYVDLGFTGSAGSTERSGPTTSRRTR